jgi:hypothetical protein
MKKIKLIFSLVVLLAVVIRCSVPEGISQDLTLDKTTAPTALAADIIVTNDNSGLVTVTPSASGAGTYDVYFGDGNSNPANVQFGGNITHTYKEGNYTIKVVAKGLNGVNIEKTYPISLVFRAPENLTVTFTKSGHNLKVKANALYAASYLVYFGDAGASEVGTPFANAEEISHNYAAAANYNVKVVALSGGVAKTEKITAITINDPFEFPITYENPLVAYSFVVSGTFSFLKVANPFVVGINTSATVGKFAKIVGGSPNSASTSLLDSPIDFTNGKKIKIWIYNPNISNINKKLTVELVSVTGSAPVDGVAVLKIPLTTSGVWEEFIFDFGTIPAIPATAKFNKLIIRFNDISVGRSGETFYLDNFRLTN